MLQEQHENLTFRRPPGGWRSLNDNFLSFQKEKQIQIWIFGLQKIHQLESPMFLVDLK